MIGSFIVSAYRVLWNSALAFAKNEDSLKASALTYYTLISIVPFLAVAFGIASGFGFEQYLENELNHTFEEQEEIIQYAIKFARSLLQNTRGSVIAGVGFITLLWTNLSMLATIENALNDIWHVRQPRSWAKKLSDYLAVMIICPIFLVVSSSVSVFLVAHLTASARDNSFVSVLSPFILFLVKLVPFFSSIFLFVVIYLFIPNVRVRKTPRIISGIIAGIAFQFWQWLYIKFQVEISSYGAIYGTFAALPLFLFWLQVSWLIVLAGAELASHIENETIYVARKEGEDIVDITPKALGLLILQRCIHAFNVGDMPPTSLSLAKDLGVTLLAAQQVIDLLEDANLLVEVGSKGSSRIGFQPSKDARLLTIHGVCEALEEQIGWKISIEETPVLAKIEEYLKELSDVTGNSPANLNMQQVSEEVENG